MERPTEDVDAWVVARLGALERANRRLWIGVAASFTTLVSLCIAGAMFAAHLEVPESAGTAAATGGLLTVDDLEVRRAVRLVDEAGHTLISLGREVPAQGGGEPQAVLALFAGGAREPQQTVRVATSSLGSALSLASVDGSTSSSLFAGASGVSLELRRGAAVRTWTEAREPGTAVAAATVPAPPPPPVAAKPGAAAPRTEADALAPKSAGDGSATIDLTNPTLQAMGSGFLVGPTSVTDSSGGVRVRGRIVNATSVDQARAEFKLAIGSREVSFSVARVAAGGSAPFAVELAVGGKADVRTARMRWVRSAVSYSEE
ncbi:MAG TPA: hypothetical protein VMR31_11710 [Myxococcota bacterium]|nr:hypothetical protein [Myxococcota bacterium]